VSGDTYPGGIAPRNRAATKKTTLTNDSLNGARSKVYRIGGSDKEFFTVGELAKALSRKPVTIRMWEQRGWIPKVKYRTPPPAGEQLPGKTPKGRRLYSKDQVVLLSDAATKYKLGDVRHANWVGFRAYVQANWPA
jgi:hypothetical protein